MNRQDIRDLFDYNDWVNRRLLATAAHVTPEQFTAPSSHSFSSLQATLVHTLDAEMGWRLLLQHGQDSPLIDPADFPDVPTLQARWAEESQAWRAYLDSLSDHDLNSVVRLPGQGGSARERLLWHLLFHVVNHGAQHRSEVAHLLTTYGHSPGDIDVTDFLSTRPTD